MSLGARVLSKLRMNESWSETYEVENLLFFSKLTTWNYVVFSVIILCGIVTNGLLLFAIHKDPLRCFRTPTAIFIFNLAVSDLLSNCINFTELLLPLVLKFGGMIVIPNLMGEILFFIYECLFFSTFPSVFGMAVERYLAVCRPLWHNVHVTRRVCYYWIIVIWLVIFGYTGTVTISIYFNADLTYYIVQSCFSTLFFAGTILIYILAMYSIRRKRQAIDNITSEVVRHTTKVRLKNQNNFLNTILIVTLFMTLGLFPSITYLFTLDTTPENSIAMKLLLGTFDTFNLLNYAINPFLYFLRLQKYRKTFLVLYWKKASWNFQTKYSYIQYCAELCGK